MSSRTERALLIERVLLYGVVLALALVIAYFAYETECRWGSGCEPQTEGEGALTQLTEMLHELSPMLSDLDDALRMERVQPVPSLAPSFDLDDIAPRIADSVYARLEEKRPVSVAANFTFLYENARLNDAQEIAEDSVGVKLAPRHERRLELLERAFGPCQRDGKEVEFVVTGFSSTAEFQEETPTGERSTLPTSNELNRITANLRAEVVADRLKEAGFKATTRLWETFAGLRRPYLDDSQQGDDQQALNRAVFIEVAHAGACDIGRLVAPVRR